MYSVYWMDGRHNGWTDNLLFTTRAAAVRYVEEQGYRFSSGWYRRKAIGWEVGDSRALITKMKIYEEESE